MIERDPKTLLMVFAEDVLATPSGWDSRVVDLAQDYLIKVDDLWIAIKQLDRKSEVISELKAKIANSGNEPEET